MHPRKVRNVQEYHNMYRPVYIATIIHTSLYIITKDFIPDGSRVKRPAAIIGY